MSAERVYRLLLLAYPREFRAAYGREMVLLFRDQCREGDVRTVGFWAQIFWDVLRSAPGLRVEATRTIEVTMKIAAALTVLLGGFAIFGEIAEWMAATQPASGYVPSIVLGIGASGLLLGAGVAILLRMRRAARVALGVSLGCFLAARLLFPWMGIFVQLVGFGMPVALLIALY